MKKLLLILFCVTLSIYVFAQKKEKKANEHEKSKEAGFLHNQLDSVSYAIGISLGNSFQSIGIDELNYDLLTKALSGILSNNKEKENKDTSVMDAQRALTIVNNYVVAQQAKLLIKTKTVNEAKLAEIRKQKGVIALPSGVLYEVIKEGTGIKPTPTDTITCNYKGSLLLDGTEFDNSFKRGQPLTIALSGLIPGWVDALQQMHVGSEWKVYIPSDLAYGDKGAGNIIKPGSALVFDVELLSVKKPRN